MEELFAFLEELDSPFGPLDAFESRDGGAEWLCSPAEPMDATSLHTTALDEGKNEQITAENGLEQPQAIARQKARASRRFREKSKLKFHELQTAATELTARRDELVAKRKAVERRLQCVNSRERVPGWKGVALRQLQRRFQAEAANKELRTQVRAHRALVGAIQSALYQHLQGGDAGRTEMLLSTQIPATTLTEADRSLIAAFTNEMAAMHARTDDIFSASSAAGSCRTEPIEYNLRHAVTWDPQAHGRVVELVESYVVPIAMADGVHALPLALASVYGQVCSPAMATLDDAMAFKFRFDAADGCGHYESTLVTKVFEKSDHTVVVWRSFTKKKETGLQYEESGWAIARSLEGGESPATLVQMCTRILPHHWQTGASGEWDEYLDMSMRDGEHDAATLSSAIENIVMDMLAAKRVRLST